MLGVVEGSTSHQLITIQGRGNLKRPSFQFYPSDWRNEAGLKLCSLSARGLWIEMMCIMHTAEPYGHLCAAGRPLTHKDLAKLVGDSERNITKLLAELDRNDVLSKTDDGIIFSRRMVKDEALREIRASGGEGGKDFGKLGAEHGIKGGRPSGARGDKKPPLKPPPSSSSSTSSASTSSTSKSKTLSAAALLASLGVSETVAADWIQLRNQNKAPVTETALQGIKREAESAGKSLEDALKICCERGWRGFKASWLESGKASEPDKEQVKQAAYERLFGKEVVHEAE